MCLPYRSFPLALPLLVAGIGANHSHDTVAPDNLAIAANLLD
jgi:hypothetical protein